MSLYDFVNTEGLFPGIHRTHPHFCLLTLSGVRSSHPPTFSFWNTNVDQLSEVDRQFTLNANDMAVINPLEGTCPVFRSHAEAEIAKTLHRQVPVLGQTVAGEQSWRIVLKRMFNMTDDSPLFKDGDDLMRDGFVHTGFRFVGEGKEFLPLYEAQMMHQFDHKWSSPGLIARTGDEHRSSPYVGAYARYWIDRRRVEEKIPTTWPHAWLLGWREVTNTTNERTVIAAIIPRTGVGHTCHMIYPSDHDVQLAACLLGALCSFVADFAARQKIGGTHLTHGYLKQLPIPTPAAFRSPSRWDAERLHAQWVRDRVVELTFTAYDLEPFSSGCGYDGPPFHWDEARRFLIRCELDAAYFHLYGIERDDVDYIMETFPIVKRRDIARTEVKDNSGEVTQEGRYITKDTILEIYDEMAECIAANAAASSEQRVVSGEDATTGPSPLATPSNRIYKTRLNPPPGPPADAEGNFLPLPQWLPGEPQPSDWPPHIHPPKDVQR